MVVAGRTTERQAEKDRAGGFHAIDHVAHEHFFFDHAAFVGRHVGAAKAGGDLLHQCGIVQKISRQLLDRELVERHVVVEGADDPIAVRPDLTIVVEVQAVGVGVAGRIEPKAGHMLAVML